MPMKIKNNPENTATFPQKNPQENLQAETEFSFHEMLKAELKQKKKLSEGQSSNQENSPIELENIDQLPFEKTSDNPTKSDKPFPEDPSKSQTSKKETEKEEKSEHQSVNPPSNEKSIAIDVMLKNIAQLILALAQKIIHIDQTKTQELDFVRYYFKLSQEQNAMPLDISVKKIDGKLAIVLFSTGELKEELLTHLNQLTNHLKMQGIQLFSIQVEELKKEQSSSQDQKHQKRDQIVAIEGEEEEEFGEIPEYSQ